MLVVLYLYKHDEFQVLIDINKPDVVCIVESWLNISDGEITLPGFKTFVMIVIDMVEDKLFFNKQIHIFPSFQFQSIRIFIFFNLP